MRTPRQQPKHSILKTTGLQRPHVRHQKQLTNKKLLGRDSGFSEFLRFKQEMSGAWQKHGFLNVSPNVEHVFELRWAFEEHTRALQSSNTCSRTRVPSNTCSSNTVFLEHRTHSNTCSGATKIYIYIYIYICFLKDIIIDMYIIWGSLLVNSRHSDPRRMWKWGWRGTFWTTS